MLFKYLSYVCCTASWCICAFVLCYVNFMFDACNNIFARDFDMQWFKMDAEDP